MGREIDRFLVRLATKLDAYQADGPAMASFLAQVGSDAVSRAKANVVRRRIVDTGRLISSIGFRLDAEGARQTLTVGVFGVRYAAAHEFGMRYTPLMMRAMFASLHRRGLDKRPGKGVMMGGTLPARPYLQPAFNDATKDFAAKFRDYVRSL